MYIVQVNGVDYNAPDLATLQSWASEGRLLPETLVWVEQEQVHRKASELSGLTFRPAQTFHAPPNAYEAPYSRPVSVQNNLILSIFATVCCCMPFGVAAIVYAAQVDGFASRGDLARAQDAANKAKNWAIASIVSGLVISFLYIALMAAGELR